MSNSIPPAADADLPAEVIALIIRFTAAIPDLPLTVVNPRITPFLALKIRIRGLLPTELADKRLRLIYAGGVLNDTAPLSSIPSWRKPASPPPPPPLSKSKGKEPIRDGSPSPSQKIYIHCSVGDALSSEDLENEAILATSTQQKLLRNLEPQCTNSISPRDEASARPLSTTNPSPQGFDRLLSTGFTPADIATLRASFLTQLSHTHTPSDLPTGDTLRALEDRWLDSSAQDTGATPDAMGIEEDEGSALDDMFWGNVFGFFWPIGALIWGFREEGVWTRRRQIAVFTGLALNLVFGFARLSSSR
jgi:hypothetical protein